MLMGYRDQKVNPIFENRDYYWPRTCHLGWAGWVVSPRDIPMYIYGCICVYMDVYIYGYTDIWIYGYMDIWVY